MIETSITLLNRLYFCIGILTGVGLSIISIIITKFVKSKQEVVEK